MKRKTVIIIHLVYWFYILNQVLYPFYSGQVEPAYLVNNKYLKNVIITTLLNFVTFYAIYFSIAPIMKLRNKFLAVATGLVLITLLIGFRVPTDYLFWKIFGGLSQKEMTFEWNWVWNDLRLVIITGIYSILIYFMIKWFEAQKLKDELINQRQASELALLRSQVNPHFLFNTLNNIYSLVYHKSDDAPAAVMKLSSIMRYMLYDATTDQVPLDKEIEYLKSFIELQALRIKHADFVSLQIQGNTEGRTIAPMLLIPFVENAFKHGGKTHQPGIFIMLIVHSGWMSFEVSNYLRKTSGESNNQASGIGMANIRRRLELLYPGKHQLVITSDKDMFRINLEIES
ncbi:MAG TPA: histidine kinase [Bacteroidales bacterium]|nr:histidine kinase [Bacteroidales bacterium]